MGSGNSASNAAGVARHLSKSLNLVIPHGGHGYNGLEGTDCVDRLQNEYVAKGTTEGLDTRLRKGDQAQTLGVGDEEAGRWLVVHFEKHFPYLISHFPFQPSRRKERVQQEYKMRLELGSLHCFPSNDDLMRYEKSVRIRY